jgi:hypothetical protein
MPIRYSAFLLGAIVIASSPAATAAALAGSGSLLSGRALLRQAASVMDAENAVHGEGIVSTRYYKQHFDTHVSGDCDASKAKDRSGSNMQVQARTWVRGRYPMHGKLSQFDGHYIIISTGATSLPRVWERSTRTKDTWKRQPYNQGAIASYAPDLCSVLFMAQVLETTNVKQTVRDLGTLSIAGKRVRFVRVTAHKPGESFEYDWYIDHASFRVVRLRTVIADAAPAPPNTSQSVTFTYSGFGERVNFSAPT